MFGKQKVDFTKLINDAMQAYVVFSEVSFIPADKEKLFVVENADIANAFLAFITEYPDADLSDLNIHCKL